MHMAGSIPIIMDEPSVERERVVRRFFEVPAQHARRVNASVLAIKPNREFPRAQRSGARARMDCNVQTKR